MLNNENIELQINESDIKRIPANEPFICVCNQLFGQEDELILEMVFQKEGRNFKVISPPKQMLQNLSQQYFSGKEKRASINLKSFFKTLKNTFESGHSIGLILSFKNWRIDTPGKKQHLNQIAKAIKKLKIPIVPVRLDTDAHPLLQVGIRNKLVKRNKSETLKITVRIGNPIYLEEQEKFSNIPRFRKFLQSKIFALGSDLKIKSFFKRPIFNTEETQKEIAEAIDSELIQQEIENLTFENLITSQANYDILVARAKDVPNVLLEIGRLREITFRSVGEGTGKQRDIDEFDLYYHQLIIWDKVAKKIVGGYRMGKGDEIFSRYGITGFYIFCFFKIKPEFFQIMRQAVELGRSYIVPEYQRKRLPLFLLWKGILYFLIKNPQYQYLYGPVSISKYYSNISKGLIVAFIKKYFYNETLAQYLKPRKPFKIKTNQVDIDLLMENLGDEMTALDSLVEDIEPQHFRLPVLIRQYVKLNARFISFNIDPNFSDCLDGFIILDLKDVPLSMMEALKKES